MKLSKFLCCAALIFGLDQASAQSGTQTLVLTPSADNSLFQESGDLSNGSGPNMYVGRSQNGLQRRALLRFDLATLPAAAVLSEVRLELALNRTIADGQTIFLHRVNAAWGEGSANSGVNGGGGAAAGPGDATWTQRIYPNIAWATLGGEYVAAASASTYAADVGPYAWGPTAALLADIEFWRANPANNFGWLLRADESVPPPSAKRFAAREASNAADRPRLVIRYEGVPVVAPEPVAMPANGGLALLSLALLMISVGLAAMRRHARQ